jgi:hypothetical protein
MAKITEKTKEVKSTTASSEDTLNQILARLEAVESENKSLKKVNQFAEAKKINDDPKQFSYKIRG